MKKIFLFLIFLLMIGLTKAADQQGTITVDIKGKSVGDDVIKLSSLVIISPSSIDEES